MSNKKEIKYQSSILTSPLVFFIMGIIGAICFFYTSHYFSIHHFFDPTLQDGHKILSSQLGLLEYMAILPICFGFILIILKPYQRKKNAYFLFSILSVIFLFLLILGFLHFIIFWQDPSLYAKPPNIYPDALY